jgi:hypothetical protein
MGSLNLIRWAGLAAMVGGLLWVVKGGSILLTGQQPSVVFEAAMPLFAVGLAWMLLGYSMLVVNGATVEAPVRVR